MRGESARRYADCLTFRLHLPCSPFILVVSRHGRVSWPRRIPTTPSWSVRAARAHRPRCCSPARATRSSSSTGRRSRATRSRRTSSTRRAWRRCSDGACSIGSSATGCPPIDTYAFDFGPFTISGAPGHRRLPGRVLPAAHRARQAARRRRGRGGGRGPRGVHRRRRRRRGRARHRHPRPRQGRRDRHRARAGSSSAPTAATRSSPKPCGPSSTTRSRRSCAATTRYWSDLPDRRPLRGVRRDPSAAGRRRRPTTASRSSSPAGRSPSSRPTRTTSKATT